MEQEDRELIRSNFTTCINGKFDYCYAFIEAGIKNLSDNGKMAYLIPSSIFKNVFAKKLRDYILPHITDIYDYTTEKLFNKETDANEIKKDRLISSAVIIINKNSNKRKIKYHELQSKNEYQITKSDLKDKWIFNIEKKKKNNALRFGDYFKASNSVATLYNKAFVISEYTEDEDYIFPAQGGKIEKAIVVNTSSPRTLSKDSKTKEKIIFPYYFKEDKLNRYTEEEFESKFPNACKYLQRYHDKELKARDSDNGTKWYEYGRSQAIEKSNKEKLLLSIVVTKKVNTYLLPGDNVPYSGICIQAIKEKPLKEAKKILESQDFLDYVKSIGINASGDSIRITGKDINNYAF